MKKSLIPVMSVVLFHVLACFAYGSVNKLHSTSYNCDKLYSNELLDLSEMKKISTSDAPNFVNGINDVEIYQDKDGNNWYIKDCHISNDDSIHQYIGGQMLHAYLGEERSGVSRFVKSDPCKIGVREVKGFMPALPYLESLGDDCEDDNGFDHCLLALHGYEDVLAGMSRIGLGDRNFNNMGYVEKDGQLLAARVDYDYSFNGFDLQAFLLLLKAESIDYERLQQAMESLLAMPDCIYENIIKSYNSIDHLPTLAEKDIQKFTDQLDVYKDLLRKLLPLVKALGEGGEEFIESHANEIEALRHLTYGPTGAPKSSLEHLLIVAVLKGKDKVLDKICQIEESRNAVVALKSNDYIYSQLLDPSSRDVNDYMSGRDGLNTLWANCKLPFQVEDKAKYYTFRDPFIMAIITGDIDQLKKFFAIGVDPAIAPNALSQAITSGCTKELFKLLLDNGYGKYLKTCWGGGSCLHTAAHKGRVDLYNLILEYDPYLDDDSLNIEGKTASEYMADQFNCQY